VRTRATGERSSTSHTCWINEAPSPGTTGEGVFLRKDKADGLFGRDRTNKRLPSASRLALQEFWAGFREYALEHARFFKPGKARPSNYMQMAMGRRGIRLVGGAAYQWLKPGTGGQGVRVVLRIKRKDDAEVFQKLLAHRQEIESKIGCELVWDDAETATSRRLILYNEMDITSPDQYPVACEWLVEYLDKFHEALSPYVENL
jgi:hypothetical protein